MAIEAMSLQIATQIRISRDERGCAEKNEKRDTHGWRGWVDKGSLREEQLALHDGVYQRAEAIVILRGL